MGNDVKQAQDYFRNGLYCSQAVLMTFCERYGLDKDTAFKISCGLNSGARCADICGAASGAILVIGLKHGGSKEICNAKTEEFLRSFKDKTSGILCRDILGCDISTEEGRDKAKREGLFGTVCVSAVAGAAKALDELGY
ncbi:putative redox-active protein (C_GCAxxG_C_C) [Candidatus Methanoplasma termitum]|uniref:Putative redox-active protein (C_GCAxxG_C_C) n=1 Tax=Candidatus Methanoplasma termitum TaxID=1577791 RepID=A0A0A7LB57_9ARCH|nr:C-GCAxxG-C-C family protein [Candidatus Methanoplasma termitum]AIZ56395.1 putative redox-active protein (C_GCAxxG_C_C) [Candidatus Methanoplasma termitum]